MNFKIVSTGQRLGNLNEDPKLRIYPETNRFKLNAKAAEAIGVVIGDGVTILADTEGKLIAIHKAVPKVDKKGKPLMKDVKMTQARKDELKAEGEKIPQEIDYAQACKLGGHLECTSGNAIVQTGLSAKLVECDMNDTVSGKDIEEETVDVVGIFDYGNGVVSEIEEEASAEEVASANLEAEEEEIK